MKREYINLTKVHEITEISYDRLHRAFRYDAFEVFTDSEMEGIKNACSLLLSQHVKEVDTLIEKLNQYGNSK